MLANPRGPVPAVSAIVLRDDAVVLVKRAAEPGLGKWAFPGGSVEFGETLEDAVKRESLEETGLEIEVGDLAGASDLIVRRDEQVEWHYVLISFLASVRSGRLLAGTDVSECRWVKLSDVTDYDLTRSARERLEQLGLLRSG